MIESRSINAKRNIIAAIINKSINTVLPFLTRTIIIYHLGSVYLGLSTLFTSILSFLSLTELGLSTAVNYVMYKPIADDDNETISQILGYFRFLYKIIGLTMLFIGTLIVPVIPVLIHGEVPIELNIYILYYIYLISSVLSYFFAGYRQCLLSANQRNDILNNISTGICIFNNIFQTIVLCLTSNYYVYTFVPLVGTVIANYTNAIITKKLYPNIEPVKGISSNIKQEIAKRISGLIGSKLNSIIVHQADTIVISAFLGLAALARYGNYYYIMNSICGFIMVIFSSLTAGIGNKIAVDKVDNVEKLFNNISFINAVIVGICSVCFICLFQPFMNIWVGKELMLSMKFVILFVIYFFIYEIQRTILVFKDAAGIWYEDRYRPYASMLVNVILNITLVRFIGIYGIVFSTIIAFCVSLPWANAVLFKNLFKKSSVCNLKKIIYQGVLVGVLCTVSYALCTWCHIGLLGIIERLVISIIVSTAGFYVVYKQTPEFRTLMGVIRGFLKVCK